MNDFAHRRASEVPIDPRAAATAAATATASVSTSAITSEEVKGYADFKRQMMKTRSAL